jgi:signal transduction histidine kinase
MRRRAQNNGGTLQITAPVGGGTRLTWTARPRHSPAPQVLDLL